VLVPAGEESGWSFGLDWFPLLLRIGRYGLGGLAEGLRGARGGFSLGGGWGFGGGFWGELEKSLS